MKRILIIALFVVCGMAIMKASAQELAPCSETVSSAELRENGIGKGESAFEALTAAMNNAMKKIKANITKLFPDKKLEYSVLSKSTPDGEEIELETTLGQPNVCQQEIECSDDGSNCSASITLSFDISNWLEETKSKKEE